MNIPGNKQITLFGLSLTLKFPNVSQFLDIEAKKLQLSSGMYNEMMNNNSVFTAFALDTIDALACFTILCPVLVEQKKIHDNMTLEATREMVTVYRKEFWPWYKEILDIIREEQKIAIQEVEKQNAEKETTSA